MLESVKNSRRQSEIRQSLAELVAKEKPSDDETRKMESLDGEYRQNETRYRAALISEDEERKAANGDFEARGDEEWSDILSKFEMRQIVFALDEGRKLSGETEEIVTEMRSKGGYRGLPIPLEVLERRAGETIASGTPDPKATMPIIDRLFAPTVAARMGGSFINIP